METLLMPSPHEALEKKPGSELDQELSFTDLVELAPPTDGISDRRKSNSLAAERETNGRLQGAGKEMRSRSAHARLGGREGVMLNMYMPVLVGRNTTPPLPLPLPRRHSQGSSRRSADSNGRHGEPPEPSFGCCMSILLKKRRPELET